MFKLNIDENSQKKKLKKIYYYSIVLQNWIFEKDFKKKKLKIKTNFAKIF